MLRWCFGGSGGSGGLSRAASVTSAYDGGTGRVLITTGIDYLGGRVQRGDTAGSVANGCKRLGDTAASDGGSGDRRTRIECIRGVGNMEGRTKPPGEGGPEAISALL